MRHWPAAGSARSAENGPLPGAPREKSAAASTSSRGRMAPALRSPNCWREYTYGMRVVTRNTRSSLASTESSTALCQSFCTTTGWSR